MSDPRPLIDIDGALKLSPNQSFENHRLYGNVGLADYLSLGGEVKQFVRAQGSYLWDSEGEKYLDFLGGYGALSLGHNHPRVLEALSEVDHLPNFGVPLRTVEGALARNVAAVTPGELQRSFFCNSGTEAVEGALKLARAATGKRRLIHTESSFHGKTFGSLSVTGRERYREPFVPLLPETEQIPFGDAGALEKSLRRADAAAFIVEPIQGEGGINVPPSGYIAEARRLCSKYDTLLILDEVQTGFGRTGKMFACEQDGVSPDIMCLAKALGGGVMPIGAFVTTDEIWQKAYGGIERFLLHSSTFGGNTRACAAGIAAVHAIVQDRLAEAAGEKGDYLLDKLADLKGKYEVVNEVRGRGLLIGLEFFEPTSGVLKKLSSEVASALPKEYLALLLQVELYHKHRVMTAYTINNPNVVRLEPALNISYEDIDYVLFALDEVLGRFESVIEESLTFGGS